MRIVAAIRILTIRRALSVGLVAGDLTNLSKDLVDSDRGHALLSLDDAGFEVAAPAVDLVIDHAVLPAIGKPHAGLITSREDGNARGLNRSGEVHGAAVMADKDERVAEDGGTLARREKTAEIHD